MHHHTHAKYAFLPLLSHWVEAIERLLPFTYQTLPTALQSAATAARHPPVLMPYIYSSTMTFSATSAPTRRFLHNVNQLLTGYQLFVGSSVSYHPDPLLRSPLPTVSICVGCSVDRP